MMQSQIDLSPFVGHLKYLVVDEFDAVFSGAESSYMWSALREIGTYQPF